MSKRIMVLAAHPDDEILGLGGTLARHVASGDQVTIALIADKNSTRYDAELIEAVRRCTLQAADQIGVSDVRFAGFADQRLDTLPILEITQWIEGVLSDIQPQIIYTHHFGDVNRDHRVVYEGTLTAARPYSAPYVERILCYETPSATEWASPFVDAHFVPNVFVDITDFLEAKLNAMSVYTTELKPFPHPRSLEALQARASYWGSMIGVNAAEPLALVREVHR